MARPYLLAIAVCLGFGAPGLLPAVAGAQTFTNSTQISIPSTGLSGGTSAPYPSNIAVSGLSGPIRRVSITLNGLTHTSPGDIDMLLVAPDGAKLVVMSDAGGMVAVGNLTMALDDYGLYQFSASGGLFPVAYRPANLLPSIVDAFASPAPAFTAADSPAPTGSATFASQFNGHDGNGTWSLYVVDDASGGSGKLAAGWSITFSSPPASAGDLLISEYRVRGPFGDNDEFIEIYNASGAPHTVAAVFGTGYGIAASDGVTRCTIPNGTVIPRGGHFLCVNVEAYSLGALATGDATYSTDIADNRGIAIFNNNTGGADNPGSPDYSLASRLDAVGPMAEGNGLYTEGGGFPSITPSNIDYAIVRRTVGMCVDPACTGGSRTTPVSVTTLVDGNNNTTDFYYVSTNGADAGFGQRLGAPGPENLTSPIELDGGSSQLVYQKASGCSARDAAPNRIRDATPVSGAPFGTLDLRTRWRNGTGANITRLRFRVIDLTTLAAPAGFADLRFRTSNPRTTVIDTYPCGQGTSSVTALGTTLETPPSQPDGGGFNASLSVASVTAGTPLASGVAVTVRFLLSVHQTGAARFCLIPETLPAAVGDPFCYIGSTESTVTTAPGDFDGDQKAEMPMYNPATGLWKILRSGSGYTAKTAIFWGGPGYTAVPGDYDGDGRDDAAVYRMSTGVWSILTSASNFTRAFNVALGGPGYFPQPGDYDGDGTTDVSAASAAASNWSFAPSSDNFSTTNSTAWAGPGFTAVPGQDFDGDGKDDLALYRENDGSWRVLTSSSSFTGSTITFWGGHGYTLVPGDYNGDGQSDFGIHHRTTGVWSVLLSPTYSSTLSIALGGAGFLPMPADYDGDRKIDIAYYRPSAGQWLALTSTTAYASAVFATHGGAGDIPISNAIVPSSARETHGGDFDGDRINDVTVYNASTGVWSTLTSSSGFTAATNRSWGGSDYLPVPGDYDGDGKGDLAVFDATTATWYVLRSASNFTTSYVFQAGGPVVTPVQGDYDGDGRTDMIVYDPSTGLWYGRTSSSNFTATLSVSWGGTGYAPAPGDYDGDGKADLMVYQAVPGKWLALESSSNYTTSLVVDFGGPTYLATPADFDADGITDICVYQPSAGVWAMWKSSTGNVFGFTIGYGGSGYTAVPGDFDGDGRADIGVYSQAGGFFSILLSGENYATPLTRFWGGAGYRPVPLF